MPLGEELSRVTRSSDGQMLFLVSMASKMNHSSALGSRIAEVHNGSSLFTGDAGQGENWKVTVERPLRLHSQLSLKAIETLRFASGDEEMRAALYDEFGGDLFVSFGQIAGALEKRLAEWGSDDEDSPGDDADEGAGAKKGVPEKRRKKLLDPKTWERDGRLVDVATALRAALGDALFEDHNVLRDRLDAALKKAGTKFPAAELKLILRCVSWRVEIAPSGVAKVHKPGKLTADQMLGLYDALVAGKPCVVEYEPDADLRDSEQVALLEEGGIEAFIRREVLPYTPDAWVNNDATKIGYEVSFTRHCYKPQPLRTLAEISKLRDGQMSPDTVFRDPCLLDLLGLKGAYSERDLESAILREIEGVLLELGTGFAFVARQKRMSVGKDDFHLRRLIAVELKLESFQPAHVGQMELYLRWLDKHERAPGEEAPIGLILCAAADAEQVELLQLDAKSIRVSEYLTALSPLPMLRERLHQAMAHAREQAARRLPDAEGRS
jgi:type I restriction enzyme M protein